MLSPDFEKFREKKYQNKHQAKNKTPYTKKMNIHVLPGWYIHNSFAYVDVNGPLKMDYCKNCQEKFVVHIEYEVSSQSQSLLMN